MERKSVEDASLRTFHGGDAICVHGRMATFSRYGRSNGAAVIRFDGERGTRVVPLAKIAVGRPLRNR